jgi:hypothetical protein
MHLSATVAGRVERITSKLTDTCIDPRRVRLSPSIRRLPAPLVVAQKALLKAERTAARLGRKHPKRGLALELFGAARARVHTLEVINYAIERHDRIALRIGLGTGVLVDRQMRDLLRRSGRSGCH